jgi:hypothetical protein
MAGMPEPVDWLAEYAKVQKVADKEVLAALRQALADVNANLDMLDGRQNVGSLVRTQQFEQSKRAIKREIATVLRRTGDIIAARRMDAAARAMKLSNIVDKVLFQSVGKGAVADRLAAAFEAGQEQALETMMARMGMSRIPLVQRVYNQSVALGGQLEKKVNSAIARGLSAREFAMEVRDFVSPNTPGGVRYASMRLARTEINNAYHAMSAVGMQKPWINGAKWNLSGSHPRPDICDKYAKDASDGMGPGVYSKAHIPSKPHPHCLCYITPMADKDDDFLDALVGGKYDDFLKTNARL